MDAYEFQIYERDTCMNAQPSDWNDLRFVLAVCREGSLSGAARTLEVNHSTVFRRIGAIEEKLGVSLFQRLPGGYVMTEAGEAALAAAERIEEEMLGLSRALLGKDLKLAGELRVSTPDALTERVLMPHLVRFTERYPAITLNLEVTNGFADLNRREADIAIRVTRTPPDRLIGRRLCALVGTIYGPIGEAPSRPEALGERRWLLPGFGLDAHPAAVWVRRHFPRARVALRSDSFPTLMEAARQGMGIAPLPCFLGDSDPGLRRVLPPPKELEGEVWLLSHPDLRHTARVRALNECLREAVAEERERLEGTSG